MLERSELPLPDALLLLLLLWPSPAPPCPCPLPRLQCIPGRSSSGTVAIVNDDLQGMQVSVVNS